MRSTQVHDKAVDQETGEYHKQVSRQRFSMRRWLGKCPVVVHQVVKYNNDNEGQTAAQSGIESRQCNSGRSLDIIIETQDAIAIDIQQVIGIGGYKILKLQQYLRKHLLGCLDQFFNQGVIGFAPQSVLVQSQV